MQHRKTLAHRYVASFISGGISIGRVYLTREYSSLGTLREILGKEDILASISWSLRFRIVFDIVRAMEFLHSESFLHKYLCSDNILVCFC
jgi:serine/threonine protein kinase